MSRETTFPSLTFFRKIRVKYSPLLPNADVYFTVFIYYGEKDTWGLHCGAEHSLSNAGIFDVLK